MHFIFVAIEWSRIRWCYRRPKNRAKSSVAHNEYTNGRIIHGLRLSVT